MATVFGQQRKGFPLNTTTVQQPRAFIAFIKQDCEALRKEIEENAMDPFELGAWSVKEDRLSLLKLALEYCSPLAHDSLLLRQSVEFGSRECFAHLLEVCNPQANHSEALFLTIYYERGDMYNTLRPLSCLEAAATHMESNPPVELFPLLERFYRDLEEDQRIKQAQKILSALPSVQPKPPKKI